ncbi:GNAT family N-acetyltransferase [uncultured Cohaesibacter sp.]|uniref:GNAT family N-acetyltransferase n=1 Tax=uncultured Cohaesibacter sp. TaxID=1002546 RepID=UPI0029318401|nr:GNAT family N-acetyltransferase [uncultured Cohaesibacter sp.]
MSISNPQSVMLRTAKIEDLDQLVVLENTCFTSDVISARSFRSFIRNDTSRLILAVNDEDLILGYVVVLLRSGSDVARLYSLAVLPGEQGKGIGTELLAGAEAIARETGRGVLSLEVRIENARAREIYTRRGYSIDAELPGFYEDGADGIRMVRHLDNILEGTAPANRSRLPIIIVDRLSDLEMVPQGCRVMTVRDYLALEYGVSGRRIINLARSYEPMSLGYYCSLLANARKERCLPEADALLDINWKRIHKRATLTLQTMLNDLETNILPDHIDIHFGRTENPLFRKIARQAFDLFRCPIIRILLKRDGSGSIADIEAVSIHKLSADDKVKFNTALKAFLKGSLAKPAMKKAPSAIIAILANPNEESAPSDAKALAAFADAAIAVGARADFITAKDYRRLLEFDALFIRETTALDHHTYRFAKRALQEGMPVIDDPDSILRCTNKIYLAELLKTNRIPTPRTVIFDKKRAKQMIGSLEFPGIMKIPDGCFSKGVFKVENSEEFSAISSQLFKKTDLLMMQEYMPTDYDWRIGILDGEAIFACKYYMVSGAWKIYEYENDGSVSEGDHETVPVEKVPAEVINCALKSTQLIGNGLYGVDLKLTPSGPSIIEVNDNPSIDFGIEDAVLGSALYERIMAVLVSRIGRANG